LTNKNRSLLIRLKSSLVIIEHEKGISIGHIDKQVTISHPHALVIIRDLHDWISVDDLLSKNKLSTDEINLNSILEIISTLDEYELIEQAYDEVFPIEYVISDLNEVGIALAALLLHHGISVRTLENTIINFSDVRGQYFRLTDVGRFASDVLNEQKRDLINNGNCENFPQRIGSELNTRTLMIITAYSKPELLAELMAAGTEHVVAIATASSAHIGPFVIPGQTPCFHCIELHLSDRDENWQKMATALFLQRDERVLLEDAYFTSALLGRLLIRIARGEIPHEVIAHTLTVPYEDVRSRRFPAQNSGGGFQQNFHPECSCHWGRSLSTRVG